MLLFSFFLNHWDQKLTTSVELRNYKSWALTVIAVMSMIVSQKARLEMTPLGAVFINCKKKYTRIREVNTKQLTVVTGDVVIKRYKIHLQTCR